MKRAAKITESKNKREMECGRIMKIRERKTSKNKQNPREGTTVER
jgi:hypothetical protein